MGRASVPCLVAAPTVVLYHAGQEEYFNGLLMSPAEKTTSLAAAIILRCRSRAGRQKNIEVRKHVVARNADQCRRFVIWFREGDGNVFARRERHIESSLAARWRCSKNIAIIKIDNDNCHVWDKRAVQLLCDAINTPCNNY